MPDNVDKLFEIMQAKGAASDRGKFRKVFLTPGNKGYKIRKDIYDGLRADGIIDSPTYEDFRRKLRLGGTPTVNKYRQQMFNSVDPNKSRASELTHRAVGQAVRATNNVRKPVTAKVLNRKGKPTGNEFAITPAKTVEDLDREYAQETTKNWENELHDQMADADRDAAKISDMFKSFIGSTDEVGSVWGNMTRGGGIAGTPHSVTTNNGIMENTEARQILAAGDYNRKRRELLQLEQDSRNGAIFDDHSFWRGMYDAAKDTGFLTGGASDLINAGSLLSTKQDLDNGVHTEAGDMLMQQAVKNSDAQSLYGDNKGWMYTGGVITTNMAPFMVQIGSAGFSKGMSTSIGKVVQGAASKVALGTMEKATGIAGAHIANYIGKVTGLTTKTFGKAIQYGIVGAAQANTVGLGNVANDVINRYTGQVYQDEQGNYKFGTFDSDGKLVHEGGEDFLTALVKGEAAQTIEFATELAGGGIDAAGTALKNFVTKGGKKIINKYNMENVSKVIDFFLNNKVSKNARYLKAGADRTLGKVEVNSIVGESLEEELGIIANTVFTGDNKISDLWDEKQQSQIWGGMLLSIGLMKGAVAPFHAYNAKQYYSYKHKLDKADVNLSQLLGKEKWEELRNQIDATTNEDMPEMVNKINRDVALGKNRQPVREYIQNLLIMRGYDIGNMLAAKKAVEDKGEGVSVKNMEKNQAYQQGRDAYGYDTHEIQLDQEDKQKSLAQLLGISEQQLASMSNEELEALSGRDDNIDRAIYDYQLSTARYEGVIDNARDQIDLEVQRAAQAVDMYTDKSRNTIRNATIKDTGGLEDYGVYIINGNIATHEDGSIDISNSDDMILYYDPTTNTVEHADAMMFAELGSEENADEVRSQAMVDAKEKAIKETTGIIDGVVEVGTQFKTVDADGTEHTYEVLADNGDGTAMITIDGNIPTELVKGENVNIPVSFEELQKMKDESDQQKLQAAKAQREQMEKERAEQQNQETEETQPSFDFKKILNDNGNVVPADVLDEDGNTRYPNSKLFLIRDSGAKAKVVELKSDGTLKSHAVDKKDVRTATTMTLDEYKQAMPESSMIEDYSGTIDANRGSIEVEDNTQPLSETDADNVIAQMESSAETVPDLELTPDNWAAEFGEDGILSTPIGDVKMGENQVAKLFEKGRSKEFGMIKPTLTNPDVIIEVPSHSTDGNEERSSSYLFIKTFLGKNGKKVYYFKSVTIRKDGLEISISSHYDRAKRVKEALMKGKLLYRKNDGAQTEQNQPSASVTTSQEDAAGSSESKDTNISSNGNENNESLTFEDGTPIPVDVNGEVDLSQTDASHAAEWYDNNLGEDADDWLDGEIKKAKKVLEQAKNKKLTGSKPSELVASKKEKEAAIADAQAHYDSAISIRDSLKERRIAKEENTSEGRKELIEKARRKFARLKSAVKDDADAVSQLYRDTIGSLLHRLYDGTGIDVTDTIPLTAEEYVASNLGAHSLNYEGTETSKGVKQETGLSREDFVKTQLLAADGKGTTIDALVHSLWENRPSNLESLDTQDIRNALIGVLNSGFKASEARNFVENIRIAQAESILEEQKRAQENAAYAEQHKAEPEAELEAKSDEKAELKAKSEAKLDNESDNKSNDLSNETDNEKINDNINDNINAPEVPEDVTDENPLGLQLSEDKVPFEIEGGKSGETYDINDNEDRQRLINDNKVDDKDILDIDMPKHVHKAIKELCKKMGLKVQFLYMGARSNGWIENGTMYLALDTEKATQFVFGHEMTHAIKQKNPEAYKELVKVAMAVTTKKKFEEDLAKVFQNYHGISGYNNVDDYVEEVVADNVGKFINDFDLAQKFSLRLNHPVLATILHAIQKIKSLLYGDFYKSVDALERIVEKAYVDTAKGEVTNSETGEDVSFSLRLKSAIEETETNPSDAQKESGNYKKGHIKFGGYDYTIENPKGSTRSGNDADGKEWKVTMHDTYGYIRGKFGKDGDHLDMFINDKEDLDNWNGDVFVVDQVNPDGSFDEHKVMYGYDSMNDAKKAYLANYSKGWQGLGNITGVSKDEFGKWLDTSNRKLKPFADYAKVKFSLKDIKPVGVGAFGNIYNQFRGNAKAAIEFLKKVRGGEAVGALHHKDIGDIDLVWGKEGTGHSDGYGLSKLVKYHPEVLDNLQEILNDMRVVSSSKNRVNLESETHKAGVRLTWDGERKSWLLTAFKKETSASDKRTDTAATSLEGDTALSQTEGSAANIDNSSETAKENGEKFSLKDEKTLAGVHNISEEKLLKAIKQGGLANPSVAVIDSSRQDHKAYGGISLILPSDKIAKRTGKNAGTWQGDAYTPTYPEVEKQMSNKGAEKSSSDVLSVPKEMQHEVRNGIDRWLNGGDANSGLKYLFLHEKGVAPEPKMIQPKFSDEAYNELKFITAGDFNIYGIGKADAQKVLDMYIEAKFDGDKDLYEEKTKAWLERNKSIVDAGAKGGMRYAIAKENVELYDEYGFNYKGVQTFVRDVEYDHRKSGVDTNATLNEVEDYIKTNNLTDEFNTWLEGKEKEYGIKEVIFDGFTPSGNRRYVPNTLENVSKLMKKQGRNGATGAAVSFQNFAARLMPSYGTLKDIRSKKGLLTSDREKFDKFREKWSNVFFELGMKCQPDATGTFDDYGLARLSEAAMTSDPQAYLKKEYNVDFSDEDTKRLKEMVKAIKEEHPAMYFETKFERPVRFDEFSAAVVPTTTKKEVKEALKNAGVSIFEYDEKNDADRSRAFNEAINSSDNIRFSLKSMMEKPEGWKQANKKAIHIAEVIERDPKFSLKNLDGTLIKAGTYFSGGGLVEEGLKGIIDPVVAVEYDEKISGVYRNNFGQHIVTADVRDVDPRELVKQIDGEVEYFHASPVCKNYSQAKSNHAEVELDKETAVSTAEFINAIKPKVVTIENVKGYKDSEAMKTITDALDANGYTWDADVYNAADYGGYTNRERLIVRAVRDGKLPEKPKKMARKSGWYEAVADIIPTLTEKKNGVAPWMDIRLKADGIDWRNIDKPLYVMGSAYADGKVPHAFADELLPTLRTKSGDVIVMPDGKVYRAMGRVLARVSGVSDDYKMPFSENLSHTIIGNGIPTQLTEHVIAPLLQNTLRPTTPEDGNIKFSLRYDQFEHDLNQWKKDNNLPKDAQRPTIPQRNAGESAVDFLRRVDEYRKQMALWKTAPTYEQHLLSDDTALGEFNRELQRGSVLKRIAFQDSMLAIRKAQEAIMKEVGVDRLNMAEDAYTAENRSHGKGKNEFEEYNNEFLQPLRKAYHQMKKILGDSYDNVRIYMMAKHGLERDAQMAFKKSLETDYEDVAQRSAAYKAYKGDMNRIINDSDLEFGRVDFTTWRQRDNAFRVKYSPSYMDYRYDKNGIAYDYSGLSALFDGSDFEEAAYKLVKDIEDKYVTETHNLWDATNAATKKILRDGYKAGMMSKDTYQYVRDMYSHYIPLRGWDGTTADQVWDYIGGGKGAFNQTLKTAHGRTSIADDPIAYIENMAESGILLNNKNWVKQHLMLLAQNHPTSLLTLSKAWYVKSTDANGNEEWIPATPQITSQMNSNQVKAAIDAFEKKMEQMAQTGDATQKRDGLNIAYPQTHSEEREHEVRVMKDGEEYVIYVNGDPQLAQAMNNTRAHRVSEGIKNSISKRVIAVVGRKMAAAYTSLSPLFIPSNYFRDLTMTLASTAIREDAKYNYLLSKNLATSWNLGFMLKDYQNGKLREKVSNGNATPKEQMFYDFMMNGGETGFVSSLDVEDLKKKFKNDLKDLDRWKANPVKVGHTIMDCIEFLNRMIEDSNRFAIYMTSIQYGRSIDEAVNDAKDVTLNFNRKGTGEHSWQTIRNLYLFINPAVQSLQTLGALAKHHPFKFTAVTASWIASGVLVPIVNAALMQMAAAFLGGDGDDDKDWYKDISKKYWQFSKWDRRNNFIMWVPTTHEFVKIPLAQEFRAFYGLGDMIASKMMGGELAEESWEDYGWDLVGQVVDMLPLDPTGYDGELGVSLMPNPIRPVFELAFNVDFTGKPLFKDTEYNKYDPNFTKAYVGTPDWLVRASRMMNSIGNDYPDVQQNKWDALGNPRYNLNNPAVVDHVLSSYLGGAYTMGSQVLGLLTKSLNDQKEIKMADIPVLSKFVSNPDDRPVSKKQGDEFWDKKEYYDRAANTISKLKKQAKIDGDYSLLERFYGSEEYKTYKLYEKDVKDYNEARKKERAEESGDEYRPHQLNAEDIYNNHATPMDEFEDMKLKQLFEKLNSFKTRYDAIVDNAPNESDGYYNINKAAIDAIDEIALDKQEISELKKGFLDDGKDAYNAEDMKQIRELRKKILAVLEKANKVVVASQKAKAEK
jgi:site-specific DNA-cytosine methylase